ncbi:MAG: helix-turn-helix domain-containing protein [Dysgonamonadaceae bacterium]|nr:helix-turn-helix domain-containing protein [Dysgonamonadaceae bacterium]
MAKVAEIEKVCEWCKQTFIAQKLTTRYCSHRCNSKAYKSAKREENHKTYKMFALGMKRMRQIEALSEAYERIKDKEFLSVSETAILLGVGRTTIYRYLNNNTLKAVQTPGKTFIRRSDIDAKFKNSEPYSSRPKRDEKIITEFYTLAEIKKKYKVQDTWIYKVVRENKIPKTLINGKSIFSKKHIDKYFEKKNPTYPGIDEWYSVKELQEKYQLSLSAIYSFVSENNIPRKKIGRNVFYSKTHFDIAKGYATSEFYSVKEAMSKFGVSRDALYNYLKNYKITRVKSGRYIKISKPELDKLFESLKFD